jgi:hypothetical protein
MGSFSRYCQLALYQAAWTEEAEARKSMSPRRPARPPVKILLKRRDGWPRSGLFRSVQRIVAIGRPLNGRKNVVIRQKRLQFSFLVENSSDTRGMGDFAVVPKGAGLNGVFPL